jgi:hypothetical protein
MVVFFRGSLAIGMETWKNEKHLVNFFKDGSQIGLLGRRRSFQRGMGEHA